MNYIIAPNTTIYALTYVVLLSFYFLWKRKRKNIKLLIFWAISIIYFLMVMSITFIPITISTDKATLDAVVNHPYGNLIPFASISSQIWASNLTHSSSAFIQISGNILLLAPLIVIIDVMTDYKFSMRKLLLIGFLTSVLIELTQLIIDLLTHFPNKVSDIDDVILNTFGVFLSTLFCHFVLRKFFGNKKNISQNNN
jgi:glycopeptide antibiotics resistance protein